MSGIQQVLLAGGGGVSSGSYLDVYSPRMVLSFRKLISTATASMRIRRSSDNAEQDIGFSGNALDTSAIASFVGANSAFVVTMYDQTGNGEHATQSTAGSQPRIVNAGSIQSAITFDNVDDHLIVSSLAMGSAYCGLYFKGTLPANTAVVDVLFEMSVNYNNNAQSFVVYNDGSAPAGIKISSRNSTSVNDFRQQTYGGSTLNTSGQRTILFDRTTTGTSEINYYAGGTLQTPTVTGTPADQTGVYNALDMYIGGRVSGSLYSSLSLESLVVFNSDSSANRTSIESLVA